MSEPIVPADQPPQPADAGAIFELEDELLDVEDTADGGAIIRMENAADDKRQTEHFANIVDDVDQNRLSSIVSNLLDLIEKDKTSREKRDKLYEEGLRRTGLGDDAPGGAQFTGANKVVHPLLVEACVDFSARCMKELFPPAGPVKSKIVGEADKAKIQKARRKAEFMNWQTTEQMPEFRGELEQLSTQLPLGGGQYLKFCFNHERRRPQAEFVPIDDMLLPFAATNFYSAERRTHVQYPTRAKFESRIRKGEYRDTELSTPLPIEFSAASIANDKIEGREQSAYNEDGLRTVYEVSTRLDIESEDGEQAPYLLTIDLSTRKALCLYRNWDVEDETQEELDWIVEFPMIPWRGAYPIGLTHLIGGLSAASTGALRALLDSAHIQNVPTLLKLKGGPSGQTLNVQPTEVVEMEGGALIDDVRKLAMPLPFNGPSPTLFQLLGFLVDSGKGVVQTSFEKLSDQNPNQPVGTTMALIEQGMVVFSSIHSRLHSAMARSFKILHRINSAYLTEEDLKQVPDIDIRPEDFDGPMDVVPVSDPQIFSETQRFAQTQAILQRAAMLPQLYDTRKVEEMFLRVMKVPADEVLQPAPASEDMDPVSENVAACMNRPVYALPKQDHLAHLKTHMAFLMSPVFGQNPAIAKTCVWPLVNHLRDHLLNYYLVEAHSAVQKAQDEELIEEDAEQQSQLIIQVQQMIEQQLGGFSQQLAQLDQVAQQFKPQPMMPPDSSLQVAQFNAQARAQESAQKLQAQQALEQARLQAQQATEQMRLQAQQAAEQMRAQDSAADRQARMAEAEMRERGDTDRTQQSNDSRERMNAADNETAMLLAAAEISTGEKVAVSTGTGINPNP